MILTLPSIYYCDQQVPGLAPLMDIKLPDLNLATIPIKAVSLDSYVPILAPLPILECHLEILFFLSTCCDSR